METIETITRRIQRELTPVFEERLRAYLAEQDRDWLIEQIVRLSLDAHSLHEMDRKLAREASERSRAERIERVRALALNIDRLDEFVHRLEGLDRTRLIREGYLKRSAPPKGAELIVQEQRTEKGEALLMEAKDTLFGLLFGDESTNTQFDRTEREMLTLTLPRFKSAALGFMKATTELSALGTWQDPEQASNDVRADNIILEVEYGDVKGEKIGAGVVQALKLINNLEVNERILYARMINVEQSTLIE